MLPKKLAFHGESRRESVTVSRELQANTRIPYFGVHMIAVSLAHERSKRRALELGLSFERTLPNSSNFGTFPSLAFGKKTSKTLDAVAQKKFGPDFFFKISETFQIGSSKQGTENRGCVLFLRSKFGKLQEKSPRLKRRTNPQQHQAKTRPTFEKKVYR